MPELTNQSSKNGLVTNLIGWFQRIVKFYAAIFFTESGPGLNDLLWVHLLSPAQLCKALQSTETS